MEIINRSMLILDISLFLQLAGMMAAVFMDVYMSRAKRHIFLTNTLVLFLILINEQLGLYFYYDGFNEAALFSAAFDHILRPVILIFVMQVIKVDKKPWIFIGINTVIYLCALFSDLVLYIDDTGLVRRGPLGYTCHVVCLILLIWNFIRIVKRYGNKPGFILLPSVLAITVISAAVADAVISKDPGVGYVSVVMVSGCVFYYIWLHLRFAAEHEQSVMAEQRIKMMMTQIQPHFLFNTLTTIQALCRIDPEKASDTVEKFGLYLRQNLDSLSNENFIPCEKELEHTRIYSDIEMIRFPDLKVEYDIKDTDFDVPPLTIQPMVENAIRHGVRGKKGGLVKVSTRLCYDYHEIKIEDNGKGMSLTEANKTEGTHIGIMNVRERIEGLCGGVFMMSSRVGEGTVIEIRIPFEGEEL